MVVEAPRTEHLVTSDAVVCLSRYPYALVFIRLVTVLAFKQVMALQSSPSFFDYVR